ncbi:uncharacterized protein LOC103133325 [Poecilia formosa]|uniref:uncharacterized protein LOC103133325 n=1 Tax=Poecilia formosa TaxID=48698 RepID=UPI000444369C|nr:PREDICTED: uncharacterized protein LOC103133325 [Poecilia formosa]
MDLLWTVLLLVLVGSEAQNLVNVTVELGHDVTLNCSFKRGDIFWLTEIQNQFRIRIGQTLSNFSSYDYPDFKIKYLIEGNRLVIKNISAEDSRLYLCSKNKTNPDGDSFLLISGVPPAVKQNNCTSTSTLKVWQKEPVVLTSLSLNAALLVAVLGFLCAYISRNGFCCCRVKDSATYNIENNDMQNPQYEEIQLPPTPVPVRVSSECIYYKAQHPNPKMPRY